MRASVLKRVASVYHSRQGRIACFLLAGAVLLSFLALLAAGGMREHDAGNVTGDVSAASLAAENDAYSIGVQAYIYGLAPVIMARTEQAFTTTPGDGHAPVNRFGHVAQPATPRDALIVTPNADTLYSSAWLELGEGPVVLHVPDTGGRYYVMQLLDAYTNNFASIGRRTTGTGAGDYAIVGPGWNGSLPAGVKEVRSPTNTVWIIGRTLVNGPEDLPNVTALQQQYQLTPLDEFGQPAAPAANRTPADFGKAMPAGDVPDGIWFYEELRVALKNNPPPDGEAALMAVFGRIGLGNSLTPYGEGLSPALARGLERAGRDGDQIVSAAWKGATGREINGWILKADVGSYGFNYLKRAAIAEGGLGANVPEEAVYPRAMADADGRPLDGSGDYVLRFDAGNLPPADAFWSLTAYNATTFMLVDNPLGRYAIGDRTPGMRYGEDGSLDVYLQHAPPAAGESNWLPTPEGDFYVILRIYQPKPQVLNGTYVIPPIRKIA